MIILGMKVSFLIYNSYSLKDKRSVIKSIIKKSQNKFNVSISEVEAQDTLNQGVLGIAVVSNNRKLSQQILDQVIQEIEDNGEVEIHSIERIEL
ncbi:hypothetical protein CAT7_01322 [Carnobacterium sp. AT7]|uniref:DUF503 domain-containing protein n=1 Tax=Carnobacterium TaxID=2747 RepID=UPI00015F2D78|nr:MULTISPECIES: DUF503 domain-containing protein [Carnobacterium]EDP69285.1 hypothetical protein CAT7_01322 [Carnobacterium sp. AT7]